ncbi:response regulator [Chitinibacteraceae bacterium HSL-7]
MSKVLIVDDDVLIFAVMRAALEGRYEVLYAPNGEDGLRQIELQQPDLVLLDIEMEGLDGYQVCERIKATDMPPAVIFVSGHASSEERLAAYQVGADDFVVKPLEPRELQRKVQQTLSARQERDTLQANASEAMSVAMSAMSDTAALGLTLNSLRRAFTIQDAREIVDLVLEVAQQYQLSASAQLRFADTDPYTRNTEGRSSMMEQVLLSSLCVDARHIFDYQDRTVFNYGNLTLLVRNMPTDDEVQYGKLKDWLALLTEACAARAQMLVYDFLPAICAKVDATLVDVEGQVKQQHKYASAAFFDMKREFEEALVHLTLKETQEDTLLQILETGEQRIIASSHLGDTISSALSNLRQQVVSLSPSQD